MVFLGVIGFLIFLYGSIVVASLAAGLAAARSRALVVWIPLSFVTVILAEIAYLAIVFMIVCFWHVEAGDAPYWNRYWDTVSREWFAIFEFGGLFGVVGWVWCLKRYAFFTREPEPTVKTETAAETSLNWDQINPEMREAILRTLARKAAEEAQHGLKPGGN